MYFVWRQDWSYPDTEEVEIPEVWQRYSLYLAQRIPRRLPPIRFLVRTLEGLSDSLVNRWGYLTFNSRLREVIGVASKDPLQYLPTIVSAKTGEAQTEDYQVANVLTAVSAIDRGRSLLDANPDGSVNSVDRLELDEDKIGGHTLFRLREFPVDLIVHESVASAVRDRGCTGVDFIPIEEYQV